MNSSSRTGRSLMNKQSSSRSRARNNKGCGSFFPTLLLCGLTGAVCFYAGLLLGTSTTTTASTGDSTTDALVQQRVQAELRRISADYKKNKQKTDDDTAPRFDDSMRHFVTAAAVVDRDDFFTEFSNQLGVPVDASDDRNQKVLLLYQNEKAVPDTNPFVAQEAASQTALPVISSTQEAVQNCDFLNVVLTDHSGGNRRQCIAIAGQYEAFHIQKFMRLPEHGKLDRNLPLRFVHRSAVDSGRKSMPPPDLQQTADYWKILQQYLQSLDTVLEQLRPVVEQVVDPTTNTVVILVCNFGQSELLLNFVCHARQRNLDLSHILVFATDMETRDLAVAMGLAAFYDEINYRDLPKTAARRYADHTFMKMMMAKVWCVQMVSWLGGYNVLFQDVDVIWYRNPVSYFFDKKNSPDAFDMYFQDDGNHALYYAPYSANTGFYFVRANDKTRHFFNSFLAAGDLILSTHSHQVPLIALLQEHASLYGLKIKIFNARTTTDFPGGHAFHSRKRKDFMKDIMAGIAVPYIFHMSWTHNKANKIKYYQQMGEWYLQDTCIQRTVSDILGDGNAAAALASTCCAAEALFSCHYRDKPSKHPCKDRPPIDEGRKSWW